MGILVIRRISVCAKNSKRLKDFALSDLESEAADDYKLGTRNSELVTLERFYT